MSFIKKLFSRPTKVSKNIVGLGEFEFYKDSDDQYWMTEHPVLRLGDGFDFGAIDGDIHGVSSNAYDLFRRIARDPSYLNGLFSEEFFLMASTHFAGLSREDLMDEFYLKSLTTSDNGDFEFGFHSKSKDIFIEQGVRDGVVTETFLDEGCCEV